jgi:hypothetical protein
MTPQTVFSIMTTYANKLNLEISRQRTPNLRKQSIWRHQTCVQNGGWHGEQLHPRRTCRHQYLAAAANADHPQWKPQTPINMVLISWVLQLQDCMGKLLSNLGFFYGISVIKPKQHFPIKRTSNVVIRINRLQNMMDVTYALIKEGALDDRSKQ